MGSPRVAVDEPGEAERSSKDMVLRALRPTDVEAIVDIALAAWAPIYAFYRQALGDDLFALAHPDWQEEKARQIRAACEPESGTIVCVAESAGRVVGFITLHADEVSRIGTIGNNAVHPHVQGMGIGTRMCRYAVDLLRGLGMQYVRVRTGEDPTHAAARRAYEKAGFSIQLPHVEYYRRL